LIVRTQQVLLTEAQAYPPAVTWITTRNPNDLTELIFRIVDRAPVRSRHSARSERHVDTHVREDALGDLVLDVRTPEAPTPEEFVQAH
jgi:hypothetical protein